jgi:hypothetical protein
MEKNRKQVLQKYLQNNTHPPCERELYHTLADGMGPEVGKMTINYLIPLHKPWTSHVGDIVHINKNCRIERLLFFP